MSKKFDDLNDFLEEDDETDLLEELTQEEYEKLLEDIENFNNSYVSHLAGTANYEIVPTEDENGHFLKDEHYKIIKKECAKIGAVLLYTYAIGKNTIVINPRNMRSLVISEGEAH